MTVEGGKEVALWAFKEEDHLEGPGWQLELRLVKDDEERQERQALVPPSPRASSGPEEEADGWASFSEESTFPC